MTRHRWTEDEVETLVRSYADTPTARMAEALGLQMKQVYQKAKSMGLKKSPEYMAMPTSGRLQPGHNKGRATRFRMGHKTWNKGMKGLDMGGQETRFKPGNRTGKAAILYQPIGTVRTTKDGIRQIKVNDDMPLQRRWKSVHSVMWEEANGPIPPGCIVVFRNGNRADIRLENLECVSRAERMARNSIHRYPKEMRDTIKIAARIRRKLDELEK